MKKTHETEVKRINGYLKEITTFFDSSGAPLSQVVNPLMVELKPRDILQIFVGSFLISAPLCFTEEVWNLSISLGDEKVLGLGLVSFIIVTLFIYFNFYRFKIKGNVVRFLKRVFATYLISALSVALTLYLIDKLPIFDSFNIAIRRVIIICFPAAFGAVISDNIK